MCASKERESSRWSRMQSVLVMITLARLEMSNWVAKFEKPRESLLSYFNLTADFEKQQRA